MQVAETQAAAQQREAVERRQGAEQLLRRQEAMLGSEAQLEGFDVDPRMAQYTQRYQLDTEVQSALASHRRSIRAGLGTEATGARFEQLNQIMDQAQAAAQAGNFEEAEKLRLKAKGMETIANAPGISTAGLFSLTGGDVGMEAEAGLASPMARTVGGLVAQGREFLDPESATSLRYKEALTGGALEQVGLGERRAERAIAGEERKFQRGMRDIGLARGAGRGWMGELSIAARASERFGTALADVHEQAAAERATILGEAALQFETYSREFAQSSAEFGQRWLQNQGGIREEFQGAVDRLKMSGVELANQMAGRHAELYKMEVGRADAKKAARKKQMMQLGGLALGVLAGPLGGMALGALGSALGAGASAAAGAGSTATSLAAGGAVGTANLAARY
jgi:hypothetical protein